MTQNMNKCPLRAVTFREVRARMVILTLDCGHTVTKPYAGWQARARCAECAEKTA